MDTAFDILVEQYRPMLLSYARALLGGDAHEAEDVVQESFLTAHRRLEDFRPGENFGAWLRGIARNKALESHRSARQRRAIVDSRIIEGLDQVFALFEIDPAGEEPWRERVARLLRHCIAELNQHMRDTVHHVYRDGLSLRETAASLQSSPTAIAQRLSRARELIRKCVAQHAGSEA